MLTDTVSYIFSLLRPNETTEEPIFGMYSISFPSKSPNFDIQSAISRCSFEEPMLFIMFALYEIMAMFPTSYGLLGSIRSTDGKLSRLSSYEIGIPRTGQVSGTVRFMNSDFDIRTLFFLPEICFHSAFNGVFIFSSRLRARINGLFFMRYSLMYSECSFLPRTPFSLLCCVLRSLWHFLHFFSPPRHDGKEISGLTSKQTMHCFSIGLTPTQECESHATIESCKPQRRRAIPPRPERRGLSRRIQ